MSIDDEGLTWMGDDIIRTCEAVRDGASGRIMQSRPKERQPNWCTPAPFPRNLVGPVDLIDSLLHASWRNSVLQ